MANAQPRELTRTDKAALKIVDLTKALLIADNHFLSAAIGRLQPIPGNYECAFATNGSQLGVDTDLVCLNFKIERVAPKHDLLHVVLHCIFLHPYVSKGIDHELWNLACDIAVERNVMLICGQREGDRGRTIASACNQVEGDLKGQATAERIYNALAKGQWADHVREWMRLFEVDDHEPWYKSSDAQGNEGEGDDERDNDKPDSDEKPPQDADQREHEPDDQGNSPGGSDDPSSNDSDSEQPSGIPGAGRSNDGESNDDGGSDRPASTPRGGGDESQYGTTQGDGPADEQATGPGQGREPGDRTTSLNAQGPGARLSQVAGERLEHDVATWRRIAKALATNLETGTIGHAKSWEPLVEEIRQTLRERVDYRSFLRQFAAMGEVMKVSQEEFDYVFYSYGLQLYGNLPLVEPLEYRDEKRVREFVIVIDTSGSVEGDAVRRFVETTFDILKDTESFHRKVRIHIIQCDARVQTDDVISTLDELATWANTMEIHGLGGTDFRPAFDYVNKLVDDNEFEDLGGLVYFTDGRGTYPEQAPSYKTAFVFYDEAYRATDVPPWAAQVVLDEEAIGGLGSPAEPKGK